MANKTEKMEAAATVGFDPEKAKAFLRKVIPLAKFVAALTPTPVDDMIVGILEAWLADPSKIPAAFAATKE